MSESPESIRLREELAERWVKAQPTVSAFVFSMVHGFDDAEDLVQQVAVEAARRFEEYDRSRPFAAWLIWIAKSRIIDYYRRSDRERHRFATGLMDELAEAYAQSVDAEDWRAEALHKCVEQLTDKSKRLLQMRYEQAMKPAQIAREIGATVTVIRTTLSRIRGTLMTCIESRLTEGER